MCSIEDTSGLCSSMFFACQAVPEVCVRCVTWMVFTFAFVRRISYD